MIFKNTLKAVGFYFDLLIADEKLGENAVHRLVVVGPTGKLAAVFGWLTQLKSDSLAPVFRIRLPEATLGVPAHKWQCQRN